MGAGLREPRDSYTGALSTVWPESGAIDGFRLQARDQSDFTMLRLIDCSEAHRYRTRKPFQALIRSIVGQQISNVAARTIFNRLTQDIGSSPGNFTGVNKEELQRLGLTEQKSACIVAAASLANSKNFDRLCQATDGTVIRELTAIKGIGRWTADMFLIFGLLRPDVWPVSDNGLRRALSVNYDLRAKEIERFGQRYRPFRSQAAWFLWCSLGNM